MIKVTQENSKFISHNDLIHKVEYSNEENLYFLNRVNVNAKESVEDLECVNNTGIRDIKTEKKNYALFQEVKSTYEKILNIEKKIKSIQNIYNVLFLIDIVGIVGFFNSIIRPFEELSGFLFFSAVLSWITYPLTIIVVLSMLYYKIKYNSGYKILHNKITLLNKFHFKSKNAVYIQKSINELEQKYVFNKWKI